MEKKANVAVILGHYKNASFLFDSIDSLKLQTYKDFDIYIYDNSCDPNSLKEIEKTYPFVNIVRSKKNTGFAGGNNLAMREVLKIPQYEYITLMNDDMRADKDWLKYLVEGIKSDPKIGSIGSKLIFFEPFIRIKAKTSTINLKEEKGGTDPRDLGVKFYEDTALSTSTYARKFMKTGFWGMERYPNESYSWTNGEFEFDLPIGKKESDKYILKLHVQKNPHIENQKIKISFGSISKEFDIKDQEYFEMEIPANEVLKNKFNVIQNASSNLNENNDGYDIGLGEIDEGQYDTRKEAYMLCGGSMMFKREVLEKVGLFDPYFFNYYEDTDLSLRIKRAGYKLIYEPKSFVWHIHTGSSVEGSSFFIYHVTKNKVIFVTKNFGFRATARAWKELFGKVITLSKTALRKRFRDKDLNRRLRIHFKILFSVGFQTPFSILKRLNIIKTN